MEKKSVSFFVWMLAAMSCVSGMSAMMAMPPEESTLVSFQPRLLMCAFIIGASIYFLSHLYQRKAVEIILVGGSGCAGLFVGLYLRFIMLARIGHDSLIDLVGDMLSYGFCVTVLTALGFALACPVLLLVDAFFSFLEKNFRDD